MASTAKQATEQAKRMLLGDRLQVVQQLAQAQEEVEKIDARIERERTARASASETLRARYEEARRAGWSAKELKQLGYAAPRASTGQRRKQASGSQSPGSVDGANGQANGAVPAGSAEATAESERSDG